MTERHHPRRPVHLGAEVVVIAFDGLAGVQTHAHENGTVVLLVSSRWDSTAAAIAFAASRKAAPKPSPPVANTYPAMALDRTAAR